MNSIKSSPNKIKLYREEHIDNEKMLNSINEYITSLTMHTNAPIDANVNLHVGVDADTMIHFTEYKLSTITVDAFLTNVEFHEEDMVQWATPNKRVIRVCSNFGEVIYDKYTPPLPKVKSNRGRKKKEKPKKKRQIQGSGKYMNSQATFEVLSINIPNKIYKIKIFRNGRIQIPGVINDNLDDAIDVIEQARLVVIDALGMSLDDVKLRNSSGGEIGIVMKNTIWRTVDIHNNPDRWIIDQNIFKELLLEQRAKFENIQILDQTVKLNPELYQGLTFKLKTKSYPTHSTYKIFRSGKINLDRCNDANEQFALSKWLLDFINDNRKIFMYDQTIVNTMGDDSDDSDADASGDNDVNKNNI